MKKTILVDNKYNWNRIAILEDESIVEVYAEQNFNNSSKNNTNEKSKVFINQNNINKIIGNIYLGRIINFDSRNQAAFLDIGIGINVYLGIEDITYDISSGAKKNSKCISGYFSQGDKVIVQITKDSQGVKLPKASMNIKLSGRYLVFTPFKKVISVSNKIKQHKNIDDLAEEFKKVANNKYGIIIRTSAADAKKSKLKNDLNELACRWNDILSLAKSINKEGPLLTDSLLDKIIRDYYLSQSDEIILNNYDDYEYVKESIQKVAPELIDGIKFHENLRPLYTLFEIDKKIEKLFSRKIWLKSGAYIIIDKTEAMTVIDINSGKFAERSSNKEVILKINKEAAKEVSRQLRLRDISGIIVIDFIDMKDEESKKELISYFDKCTKIDKIPNHILGMTKLGLIEMTRQKMGKSYYEVFFKECYKCNSTGKVVNYDIISLKIFNEVEDSHKLMNQNKFKLSLPVEFYSYFLKNNSEKIEELKIKFDLYIQIEADSSLYYNEFALKSL